jgi:uncharacterized membrane protein
METATAFVAADADECWRVFTDVAQLTSWVPGLRSAEILTKERGLPAEIHFEYGSFAYTLVYNYDPRREVRWQPKLGKSLGVSGFARFEPSDGGTRVTYGLESGASRTDPIDLEALLDAFSRRMVSRNQ